MQWWIVRTPNRMSVDNDAVADIDLTGISSDVWMVQWRDGHGELQGYGNGLRETFEDIIPYCGYFQQFLAKLPGLTLAQAQKVQCDLITEIFDDKRQAPYLFAVDSVNYFWDADDGAVAAMSAMMVPTLYDLMLGMADTGGLNEESLVGQINNRLAMLASNVDNNFAALIAAINSLISAINTGIVNVAMALKAFINDTMLGNDQTSSNTINFRLNTATVPTIGLQPPGIAHTTVAFVTQTALGGVPSVAVAPINPSTVVPPGATVQWIPIGQATPVDLTVAQMALLMEGIAERRAVLLSTKVTKQAAVNAMTTIPAVIDYDVTTGW